MSYSKKEYKEAWSIGETEYEGKRLIVRMNMGAKSVAGDPHYPYRIGIAIPFLNPRDDGMPEDDEFSVFADIEDVMYGYFDQQQKGIPCLIITTHGVREYITYAKNDDITEIIKNLSTKFPKYDFQHYVEQDKNWEVYQDWIS